MQSSEYGQPFIALLLAGFLFYQLFDAINTAKKINQKALSGEVEEDLEEIPEAVKSGSIFWGIFLIFLGIVLTLANFDVISYATVWDFWPVLVIGIGLKLIIDFVQKNKAESGS